MARTGVLRIGLGQTNHLRPPDGFVPQLDRLDPDFAGFGFPPGGRGGVRAALSEVKLPT